MTDPRFPWKPRVLYGLLAALSTLLLGILLLPWPRDFIPTALIPWLAGIGGAGLGVALLLLWSPGLVDTYPRSKTLRILRDFAPPTLLYVLAVDRWPDLLERVPAGGLRIAAACLPALLVLWVCWAFVRYLRLLDELQQRVELVSVALAAGLTCIMAAAAGGLHAAGALQVNGTGGLWAFFLLMLAYSLIRATLTRRYQ